MTYATIFKVTSTVRAAFKKKLAALTTRSGIISLFYANNIPQDDVDFANKNGDLCLDMGSDDIYVASNVVTATSTTWTKAVD